MRYLFSLLAVFAMMSFMMPGDTETRKLPEVSLKDMEGQEVNLQELAKGHEFTVYTFWATWCSPCKKELDNMTDLYEDWQKDYDLQVVAISRDDARTSMKVRPYVEGKGWPFKVLMDVNQDTKRLLNVENIPYTILVNRNGDILYEHTGYTEGDELVLEEKIQAAKKK